MKGSQSKVAYQNFEQTFEFLLNLAENERISIHTLLTVLSGKGRMLLLMVLSLGFAQLPGIGMVFGLFISYLGIRIAVGRSVIWVPQFFQKIKIPSCFLIKLCGQILQLLKLIKSWSKPRYQRESQRSIISSISGLMIALVGICLASSPPVPLTGFLASFAILFLVIGLLNCDMVCIILGYIFAILYIALVMVLLRYFSITQIFGWIKSMLNWF